MANNSIDLVKIMSVANGVSKDTTTVDINTPSTINLTSVTGTGETKDPNEQDMERDLEKGDNETLAKKYEIDYQQNATKAGCNTNFALEIFKKKIGFDFNIESNPPTFSIDINKYSNKNNCSGNFLQTFSVIEQIKIIETYFEIESLRYLNIKIYEKMQKHSKLFKILFGIAILINAFMPQLSLFITNSNIGESYKTFFIGTSSILTMLSYLFTRFLMSTVADEKNYKFMQIALTKLRMNIETIMLGTYRTDVGKPIQDLSTDEKNKQFNLETVLANTKNDLNNIYKIDDIRKKLNQNEFTKNLLNIAGDGTTDIRNLCYAKITEALEQVEKLKESQLASVIKPIQQSLQNYDGDHQIIIEFNMNDLSLDS